MSFKIKARLRRAFQVWVATRSYRVLGKDLRALGFDGVRTGLVTLILNIWLGKPELSWAGLRLVILGVMLYLLALPTNEDADV